MSNGRDYEVFVQSLQQAMLDSERFSEQKTIKIERNKKIEDNFGIEREFDLYWEYELAGVLYKTVIECKDYASRISIEKIDALIGKIRDIPDLKPVFATRTGYQRGAEQKAKQNRIDLLVVREQRDDDWIDKEGNSFIREVDVNFCITPCPRITDFRPRVDGEWLRKNSLGEGVKLISSGLNTEIYIENVLGADNYSLYDLAYRLDLKSGDRYGDLAYSENFEDAYLVTNGLRLKLISYEVDYHRSRPYSDLMKIDFSKELIGVIEYIHKGSSTAIFRDKIIKDWR